MKEVSVVKCENYEYETVKSAVNRAIEEISGYCSLKSGTKVAIKANLVASAAPDTATTTHPAVLAALSELLTERGCEVVIGDSPGGLYNSVFLERVYKVAGLSLCEEKGAKLNRDFSESKAVYDEAKACKTFTYTGYLDNADLIINACKLKTHGMMGLSCATKNMFGAIPGTMKPEYHFRYPSYEAFADMLIDIEEFFKPEFSICDAVVGMEGNGPTQGSPRKIGCILASKSTHALDFVAASIIGLSVNSVPTLGAAVSRGYINENGEDIKVIGNDKEFYISDYKNIAVKRSLLFKGSSDSVIGNIFGSIAKAALTSRPTLKKKLCIGCGKCERICPAKAIEIKNKKAIIDKEKCIMCFCCQEFCPVGAMRVHRTFIAKILEHGKSGKKSKNSK